MDAQASDLEYGLHSGNCGFWIADFEFVEFSCKRKTSNPQSAIGNPQSIYMAVVMRVSVERTPGI